VLLPNATHIPLLITSDSRILSNNDLITQYHLICLFPFFDDFT
jgi:hypothetical protein